MSGQSQIAQKYSSKEGLSHPATKFPVQKRPIDGSCGSIGRFSGCSIRSIHEPWQILKFSAELSGLQLQASPNPYPRKAKAKHTYRKTLIRHCQFPILSAVWPGSLITHSLINSFYRHYSHFKAINQENYAKVVEFANQNKGPTANIQNYNNKLPTNPACASAPAQICPRKFEQRGPIFFIFVITLLLLVLYL